MSINKDVREVFDYIALKQKINPQDAYIENPKTKKDKLFNYRLATRIRRYPDNYKYHKKLLNKNYM